MIKRLPRWLRWGCLVVGLAVLLFLAAVGAITLLFIHPVDSSLLPPPLDCLAASISISGEVRDDELQPIDGANILVNYRSFDGQSDWSLTLVSDSTGHFEADKPMDIFLCDNVGFTVSAAGYESIRIAYSLLDNYSESGWPTQSPIPIRINPILSLKLDTEGT